MLAKEEGQFLACYVAASWASHCWCSPSNYKKSARSRYKYEVRRLKRREQHIRREKMAAALASSNSSNFWQLVNRSRKSSAACWGGSRICE